MKTLRQRFIAGLTAMGYVPVATRSTKFKVFTRNGQFMFVGRAGSLRFSHFNRVDASHPVGPLTKHAVIGAAEAVGA
jgi:hypothetical protein